MGHTVAATLGTSGLAAQQIISAVFYALIPIADSLSLAAQSLLPAVLEDNTTTRLALRNFAVSAVIVGGALTLVTATLPWTVLWCTTDWTIIQLVRSVVPLLGSIFLFHGIFCGAEGVLLALKDLTFLGRMYSIFCVVVPTLFLKVKWRVLAKQGATSVREIWAIFLGYQAFRITAWVTRVLWLQRKRTRKKMSLLQTGN